MSVKKFLKPNKNKIILFVVLLLAGFIIGGMRNFGADGMILNIWYIFSLPAYFFGLLFPESNTLLFFPIFIIWIYFLTCSIFYLKNIKNKKKL